MSIPKPVTKLTKGSDWLEGWLPEALRVNIQRVADFHGFTPEQRTEAEEIAASDVVNAVKCFRSLVNEIESSGRKGLTREQEQSASI